MHARLFPKVQDGSFLEAREIARRVIEALPSAVVDWQRGEVWVAESLQRLIDMRTPEVILQGHRRFFGRTVHISLAYPDWPERPVELITSGIQQGLDALFLNVTPPFNLTLLEQGAADFAAALDFDYCLECNREGFIRTITVPGQHDPLEFVRWELPKYDYPAITLREWPDTRAALHRTLLAWLAACESTRQLRLATDGFDSHAAFSAAAIGELEAIAPIQRGWAIDVPDAPHQNRMLLAHTGWLTMMQLLGVSTRIVF
jgi:hypothetical protein